MGCSSSTHGRTYVNRRPVKTYNPDLPSPFKSLDVETVSLIFAFLRPRELHMVACVDRQFNLASYALSLRERWELPVIPLLRTTDAVLHRFASQGVDIVALDLSGCQAITDEGLRAILAVCTDLQELSVDECVRLTPDSMDYVASHCTGLKRAQLSIGRKARSMNETLEILASNCPGLLHLDIMGWKIAAGGVKRLGECCPQLESLSFTCMNSNVDDSAMMALAQGCARLRKLMLSYGSYLTQVAFVEVMRNCLDLSTLSLSYCQIPVFDNPDFECRALTRVSFDHVRVSEASLKSILKASPNLEVLRFRNGNHIADSWIPVCLRGCTKLKVLDVFGCPITDKGVDLLIKEVTSSEVPTATLSHLNLSHTNITDQSVSKLLNRVTSIPQIDVADCPKVRAGTILKFYSSWAKRSKSV